MTIQPIPLKLTRKSTYMTVSTPGSLTCEFTAKDQDDRWDWQTKESIFLRCNEIAEITDFPTNPVKFSRSERSLEAPATPANDTFGSEQPTAVITPKSAREIRFLPQADGSCNVQLAITDLANNEQRQFEIVLKKGDYALLRQIAKWALPHLTGWAHALQPASVRLNNRAPTAAPAFDWGAG